MMAQEGVTNDKRGLGKGTRTAGEIRQTNRPLDAL